MGKRDFLMLWIEYLTNLKDASQSTPTFRLLTSRFEISVFLILFQLSYLKFMLFQVSFHSSSFIDPSVYFSFKYKFSYEWSKDFSALITKLKIHILVLQIFGRILTLIVYLVMNAHPKNTLSTQTLISE